MNSETIRTFEWLVGEVTVGFPDDELPTKQFSQYLYYQSSLYKYLLTQYGELWTTNNDTRADFRILIDELQRMGRSRTDHPLTDNYSRYRYSIINVGQYDLNLKSVESTQSYRVVFTCVVVALVATLILGGGEMEITTDGVRVQLPPLGDTIRNLSAAFRDL